MNAEKSLFENRSNTVERVGFAGAALCSPEIQGDFGGGLPGLAEPLPESGVLPV
ncbi:MAG: hypothetical protein HFG05_00230 [Oscillibacter sp.]|nr:hypothetical protein [Oscillibacter sp.]